MPAQPTIVVSSLSLYPPFGGFWRFDLREAAKAPFRDFEIGQSVGREGPPIPARDGENEPAAVKERGAAMRFGRADRGHKPTPGILQLARG